MRVDGEIRSETDGRFNRARPGDFILRVPPGSPVKIKWQRVRFLNDNEIALPRWVVVLTFVMLLVGLVHAAVTHG